MTTLDGLIVTPADAASGEHVEVIPALEMVQGRLVDSPDHIWLKNLGPDVQLMWAQFWHDGGYCLRLTRAVAEGIVRAIEQEHTSPNTGGSDG